MKNMNINRRTLALTASLPVVAALLLTSCGIRPVQTENGAGAQLDQIVEQAPQDTTAGQISLEQALNNALEYAGLDQTVITHVKTELDREHGKTVIDVEFKSGGYEYDIEVDITEGTILKFDREKDDDYRPETRPTDQTPPETTPNVPETDPVVPPTTPTEPTTPAQPTLLTADQALAAALAHAGLTKAEVSKIKTELDRDDGKQVWEIEFNQGRTEYEYEIDALSGTVLEFDKELDD